MTTASNDIIGTKQQRIGDRWLLFLAICLLGYALLGRGFAYIGFSPLFIGEACLMAGLFAWLSARGWAGVFRIGAAMAVFPLVTLGAIELLPGIREYQVDAIRDAVVWGYSAFALVIASMIVAQPERLPRLFDYYRTFTKIFLLGIPFVFIVYHYARNSLPEWPGSGTPIMQVKEGDALVHLAGILAFWMSDPKRRVHWFWAAMLTVDMALMGVIDRAGLVSFVAVMVICLIAKPFHGAAWRTIGMLACGAVILWASQVNIEVPGGKGRNISWEQFVDSGKSIFGQSDSSATDSNKEWRLKWWETIINYTFHGPYFWTGKGFGVNLADEDGFQVNHDKSLRSPHSVHMTILARMGVPGLACWILMHLTWLGSVGAAYLSARRRGYERWAGALLFLLAYYLAFIINGSFDVFIEGPMGGIWFWSIFGTGVGALWAWRYCPQVLSDEENVDTHPGGFPADLPHMPVRLTRRIDAGPGMKILVAHNFYQQPGGEDQVFRSELALLEAHGHEPVAFEMNNDHVDDMRRLSLAASTVWSRSSARKIADTVRASKIDLVHFHNTFPLMSPSAYYGAHSAGAAVVQTLHNFRLLCAGANFFREGKVCEKCLGKSLPLPGVIHKCYRNSRSASAATVAMLSVHRAMGTYSNVVDAYITPTNFARDKFIAGGLPADRIVAKPNFVEPDPGVREGGGNYAIFVGRLSHEKGLDVLLDAWRDKLLPPLKIVGDGPLADQVRQAAAGNSSIEWLGRRATNEVFDLIGKSAMLVFPSECYETFGRTAVEAFATGTPVVASGHGAPGDVVDHGRTGLHFKPSDSVDLAAKVKQLLADPAMAAKMRIEVRREYEAKYTGARNYEMLMAIYQKARARHPGRVKETPLAPMPAARA